MDLDGGLRGLALSNPDVESEDARIVAQTLVERESETQGQWQAKIQGDAESQNSLGIMYSNGRGVPQDKKEAERWYRKAAEQGYASAQFNLGMVYASGKGVPQDDKEAVKWLLKAAEQGYAEAQYSLGFRYEHGQGVPQDYIQADKWFNLAVSGAQFDNRRKEVIESRNTVEKKMTPSQIAESQKLARKWKPKK